ncbi:MAG: ATP-binding protein [Methanospirillum sp.]
MNSSTIELLFKAFMEKDEALFHEIASQIIEEEEKKNHHLIASRLKLIINEIPNGYKEKPYQRKAIPPIPRDNEKGFPLLEIKKAYYNWNDLIAPEEVILALKEIPKEYEYADSLSSFGLKPRNKILLCGPPGTGKTLSAKILSSEIGFPLIIVKFESVISSFLGETAANLRKIFDFIEKGRWVVLFDEFDIIGKKRDDPTEHGEIKRVVNNFMLMLEDYEGESILIASTNHPQILDSGVWRRFDDIISYNLPDYEGRALIFQRKFAIINTDGAIDYYFLSSMTDGFSGADIEQTVIRAIKHMIIDGNCRVSQYDVIISIQRQTEMIQLRSEGENGRSFTY